MTPHTICRLGRVIARLSASAEHLFTSCTLRITRLIAIVKASYIIYCNILKLAVHIILRFFVQL